MIKMEKFLLFFRDVVSMISMLFVQQSARCLMTDDVMIPPKYVIVFGNV